MADMTIVKQKKTPNYFAFPERLLKSGMEGVGRQYLLVLIMLLSPRGYTRGQGLEGWKILCSLTLITLLSPRGYGRGQGLKWLGDTVLAHPYYVALPKRLRQRSGINPPFGERMTRLMVFLE